MANAVGTLSVGGNCSDCVIHMFLFIFGFYIVNGFHEWSAEFKILLIYHGYVLVVSLHYCVINHEFPIGHIELLENAQLEI